MLSAVLEKFKGTTKLVVEAEPGRYVTAERLTLCLCDALSAITRTHPEFNDE